MSVAKETGACNDTWATTTTCWLSIMDKWTAVHKLYLLLQINSGLHMSSDDSIIWYAVARCSPRGISHLPIDQIPTIRRFQQKLLLEYRVVDYQMINFPLITCGTYAVDCICSLMWKHHDRIRVQVTGYVEHWLVLQRALQPLQTTHCAGFFDISSRSRIIWLLHSK